MVSVERSGKMWGRQGLIIVYFAVILFLLGGTAVILLNSVWRLVGRQKDKQLPGYEDAEWV
ncbi:MAG: hypothetical protein BWY68_00823 [bacterium ADurb.Bin400]|nr:MAG: hypothetical protein BWY68_00823 [bacterium ADurb.Bin400]